MRANYFPGFPKLPLEVREMIWELAICDTPFSRIHYYSLFNKDNYGVVRSNIQDKILPLPIDDEQKPRIIWSQRHCVLRPHPEDYAWAKENRFRHLWDAGLRTACHESRRIILRRQRQHSSRATPDIAVARYGGEDVQLGVNSALEILCLIFSPKDLKTCVGMRWSTLLARIPFYRQFRTTQVQIAFEFDKSWETNLPAGIFELMEEASLRGMVTRAFWAWSLNELPMDTIIWLIDRGWEAPPRYHDYWGSWSKEKLFPKWKPHHFVDGTDRFIECFRWLVDDAQVPRSSLTFTNRLLRWQGDYVLSIYKKLVKNPKSTDVPWNSGVSPRIGGDCLRTLRVEPGKGLCK